MKHLFKALVACVTLLASTHSYALYRCGSVFQDRPCDAQSASTVAARMAAKPKAGSSESAAAANAKSPFALECGLIGKSSMDISWKREGGALREAQYEKQSSEHRRLVDAVYERRGSAMEVRALIEADCIGKKQRAADAAAAIAAIQQTQGGTAPMAVAGAGAPAPAEPATAAKAPNAPVKKADTSSTCKDLKAELADLQAQARRGGAIGTMERINNQRSAVERQISAAKC